MKTSAPKKKVAVIKPSKNYKKVSRTATTARNKAAFLAAYSECGRIQEATKASGVADRTHYDWMENDPDYPARFAKAEEVAAVLLETEAKRRAIDGVRQYKFNGSDPILDPRTGEPYYELKYSDTLLIFLLKGLKPERYADNVRYAGPGGGPIPIAAHSIDSSIDPEEAARRYRAFIGALS